MNGEFHNLFPQGGPNTVAGQYFSGASYLCPLSDMGVSVSNVTFEPGCRNNWHIHHDGGQILLCTAGCDRLDCALLAHKLHALFGVDRLMEAGGGILNASFLQAGLLDELSLVVAPVADGGNGAGLFGQAAFLPKTIPTAFHLTDAKRLPGDVLWLRYCRS